MVSKETKALVKQKTDGHCAYCGKVLPSTDRHWDVDHIDPRANGGEDDLDNLAPACMGCNRRKGKKTLEEFREFIILGLSNKLKSVNYHLAYVAEFLTEEEANMLEHHIDTLEAEIQELARAKSITFYTERN